MSKKYEIDMTQGSLLKSIIRFSIPLMLTGMLQILYNAADSVVIGRFAGSASLAAVGSTGTLFGLIVNLFIGLTTGTSVLMSVHFGSKNYGKIHNTVHTSIAISIILGICVAILGFFVFKPALIIMGTPIEVIDKATLYMRILSGGIPALMIYNFGSAILRSVGDTKRPLYFLTLSGIVNVVVNLILVVFFKMDVAGVAIATVLSQYISATLVVLCLASSQDVYKLYVKKIKIHKEELANILKIGLPAGIQNSLFSISNTLIQSSINLFGASAIAGSSVAGNYEALSYTAMAAIQQAATTACGQNLGAKNYKRIKKSVMQCILVVSVIGITLSVIILSFKNTLLGIFTSDKEVLSFAFIKTTYLMTPYFICGIMEVLSGALRGLRYSLLPMIVSVLGVCGFRILWIATIFQQYKTLPVLFSAYIVSWIITIISLLLCLAYAMGKIKKKFSGELND